MNEEELKAMVGEAAFNAMSVEQRAGAISKYAALSKPKEDPKPPKEDPKPPKEKEDEPDLREKILKERQTAEGKAAEMKGIENALKFNLSVAEFVKGNVDVLPAEIPEILTAAEKEKYDTAAEKASAVKKAFIESFFAVQANVDLLTAAQKVTLDDYLKLTKNGKQDKAMTVYENIFEPALETLKKVKKAEELGKARSGFASSSKVEDNYKARLRAGSEKAYLNKQGA